MDGTQGIFIFLGIFWELKSTFALFKEKIQIIVDDCHLCHNIREYDLVISIMPLQDGLPKGKMGT